MEPKKDISIYRTRDKVNKSQELSSVGGNNTIHKEQQKGVTSDVDITPCDFNTFINKKTKKLTTALYMVTSFLSDNEPLKWKLRECSVLLFSGISNVRNESISEVDNVFAGYSILVDEIISLLEVTTASKLVSEMNYLILKKEYLVLKDAISSDEYMEEKSGKFIFPNGFFGDDNILPQPQEKRTILRKDEYLEKEPKTVLTITGKQKSLEAVSKGHNFNKGHNNQSKTEVNRQVSFRRNEKPIGAKVNRREVILKLFKNKKGKEFTIKDISHEVSDCSEKTIQRELVSMVAEGVLKKRGERRWSKYSCK